MPPWLHPSRSQRSATPLRRPVPLRRGPPSQRRLRGGRNPLAILPSPIQVSLALQDLSLIWCRLSPANTKYSVNNLFTPINSVHFPEPRRHTNPQPSAPLESGFDRRETHQIGEELAWTGARAAPSTRAHDRYETTREGRSTIRLYEIYDHNILWGMRVDNGDYQPANVGMKWL